MNCFRFRGKDSESPAKSGEFILQDSEQPPVFCKDSESRKKMGACSQFSEAYSIFCKDSERWGASQTCPDRILSSVNGERKRRAGFDFELVSPFSGSGIICKYSLYSSFIGLFSGPLFVVRRSSYVLGFRFGSGPAFLYGKMAEAGDGSKFLIERGLPFASENWGERPG